MSPIDHERYSERLSPYIRGTLGPEETEEIRAHLAGCEMCRQEEAALTALVATPLEGLRLEESELLRAAVMAEITAQEKPSLVAVAPSKAAFVEPRRSWAPRIAQFMAAAAVIALAAIYLTNPQVGPLVGGGDDAEVPAAIEDSEPGSAEGRDTDGRRDLRGEGTTTTNDDEAVAEEDTAFSGPDEGGAGAGGGDSDTRTGSDDAGDTIAATGGVAPAEGAGGQVAALRANESAFGAEAAFRRQQR